MDQVKHNSMAKLDSKHYNTIIHLLIWTIIFIFPLFFTGKYVDISLRNYTRSLIMTSSFVIVFYANYFWLTKKYLTQKRIAEFTVYNLILIVAVMLAVHLIFINLFPPENMRRPAPGMLDIFRFQIRNATIYIFVVGAGVALRMTANWYKTESERKALESSRTEAELANLKSQLNPHFLFNTLNNIYSLIEFDKEKAKSAVSELSSLLRYVLYESSSDKVRLKDEILFIENYIKLMKIRLTDDVKVNVILPDNDENLTIAPLLFISPIENAFKHGANNPEASFINISVSIETDVTGEKTVRCLIKNSISAAEKSGNKAGSGIGIENLKKRLDLIYPGRYEFIYGENGGCYISDLKIKP